MARLRFTPNLARQVDCPGAELAAESVAELLAAYFADQPAVRSYVLDDQGAVRKHVAVLVDGNGLRDREQLSDALRPDSEVWILQALSGG